MANGLSLHIGLNAVSPDHYLGWDGALKGCELDADRMAALAVDQGFSAQMLHTAEATRKNVHEAFARCAATLVAGDIMLVTFAGHGGRVPDLDGDEHDLWDETWCLFDGQLIDDELRGLYAQFPAGVRVLVVADSCHSGTVIRAAPGDARAPAGFRFRVMPRAVELRVCEAHRSEYEDRQAGGPPAAPEATVRLLAACQDDQLAMEGSDGGLFTRAMLDVWSTPFTGDYPAFVAQIGRRMPSRQRPNHLVLGPHDPAFDAQRPFRI